MLVTGLYKCTDLVFGRNSEDHSAPEDITRPWEESINGDYMPNSDFKVTCNGECRPCVAAGNLLTALNRVI